MKSPDPTHFLSRNFILLYLIFHNYFCHLWITQYYECLSRKDCLKRTLLRSLCLVPCCRSFFTLSNKMVHIIWLNSCPGHHLTACAVRMGRYRNVQAGFILLSLSVTQNKDVDSATVHQNNCNTSYFHFSNKLVNLYFSYLNIKNKPEIRVSAHSSVFLIWNSYRSDDWYLQCNAVT